jgi:hypothetical protein
MRIFSPAPDAAPRKLSECHQMTGQEINKAESLSMKERPRALQRDAKTPGKAKSGSRKPSRGPKKARPGSRKPSRGPLKGGVRERHGPKAGNIRPSGFLFRPTLSFLRVPAGSFGFNLSGLAFSASFFLAGRIFALISALRSFRFEFY